jgi:hypothetical protein
MMRYLKPSRSKQVRDKVNEIFGSSEGPAPLTAASVRKQE